MPSELLIDRLGLRSTEKNKFKSEVQLVFAVTSEEIGGSEDLGFTQPTNVFQKGAAVRGDGRNEQLLISAAWPLG